MVAALTLLLSACTGAPVPPVEPVETDVPVAAEPDPEPAPEPVAWRAAWPVEGGVYVRDAGPDGSLWSATGSQPAGARASCSGGERLDGAGVLWSPSTEAVPFTKAPMVSAALVERAAWRLAESAPPTDAIPSGVETPDPALHQGIRVRSVRKIRRKGPPFQLVLGERDAEILVALTDRDAQARKSGVAITRSSDAPMNFGSLPPADLDGDGQSEIVIYGDGETGGFRAVLSVDLLSGQLETRWFEERPEIDCP